MSARLDITNEDAAELFSNLGLVIESDLEARLRVAGFRFVGNDRELEKPWRCHATPSGFTIEQTHPGDPP